MNTSLAALMKELESEVQAERRSAAKIVQCLAAIDSRRQYLELGCSSLIDLATERLGYSPSAAMRARVAIADPSVGATLERGANSGEEERSGAVARKCRAK